MSEERHVSCIEAPDSPCTPETCEETICWVCEEPDPSWPCPSRRAQDAEAAIQRVRELHTPYRIMLGSVPTDTNCNGCNRTYPCPTIRALEGDSDDE